MTDLTDHSENLMLDWLMTAGAATRPTSWYVALHTADPGETGATGELSGNGYARQSAAFTVVGSTADNDADIVFGPNTTTPWGTVSHASIWDAVSGGNCLWKGALSASVSVAVNDEVKIAAAALTVTLD